MAKCAFDKTRACDRECVAWVPVDGDDPRPAYHFSFPCVRLDSMYDIAFALVKMQEEIDLDTIATELFGIADAISGLENGRESNDT